MGKSLKNSVTPDELYDIYGADTCACTRCRWGRWSSPGRGTPGRRRDVPVPAAGLADLVDEETGALRVVDDAGRRRDPAAAAPHHRRRARRHGGLRFNTAIAKLIELNNHLRRGQRRAAGGGRAAGADAGAADAARRRGAVGAAGPRRVAGLRAFPEADPALLVDDTVEYPVQVNGKVRGHVVVPTDADEAAWRRPRWPTPRCGGAGGRRRPSGGRGARPARQRRRLSRLRRSQAARPAGAARRAELKTAVVQVGDLHRVPRVAGVHDLAVAHVDGHVAGAAVEEHQVGLGLQCGLQGGCRPAPSPDWCAAAPCRSFAVGPVDQPGAVESVGPQRAEAVARTDLAQRLLHGRRTGRGGGGGHDGLRGEPWPRDASAARGTTGVVTTGAAGTGAAGAAAGAVAGAAAGAAAGRVASRAAAAVVPATAAARAASPGIGRRCRPVVRGRAVSGRRFVWSTGMSF